MHQTDRQADRDRQTGYPLRGRTKVAKVGPLRAKIKTAKKSPTTPLRLPPPRVLLAAFCSYVIIIIRLLLRASEGDPPLLLSAVALGDVDQVLPHVPRAAHQVEEVFARDAECLAALVTDARDLVRISGQGQD